MSIYLNLLVFFLAIFAFGDAAKKSVESLTSGVQDRELQHRQLLAKIQDVHGIQPSALAGLDADFSRYRRGHGFTSQRGTSELECPEYCTMDLRPVCGSDGLTYDNKCLLDHSACKQRRHIYVEKEGRC